MHYLLSGFNSTGQKIVAMPIFAASAPLEAIQSDGLLMLKDAGHDCASCSVRIMRGQPLPTFEESSRAIKAGTASPLQRFVHAHEPQGKEATLAFRHGLAAILGDAEQDCFRVSWLEENCAYVLWEAEDDASAPNAKVYGPSESGDYELWAEGDSYRAAVDEALNRFTKKPANPPTGTAAWAPI